MFVIKRDRVFLAIYSIFVALVISGNIGIAGVKLSIIFSGAIFLYLIIVKNELSFRRQDSLFNLYVLLLIISILYALLIDSLNGNSERALYPALSEIYIIIFAFINMKFFSKLSINEMEKTFLRSNKIMLAINIIILIFSLTPSLKHAVYDMSQYGGRLKAFTDQTNGYALLLTFNFSVAFYSLIRIKNILNLISLGLVLTLGVMTQSRGLILGMFLSVFCTYFIMFLAQKGQKKNFITTIAIVGFLFLSFSLVSSNLAGFLQNSFGVELTRFSSSSDRNYSDSLGKSGLSDRTYLLVAGLKTIAENPFGIGFIDHHLEIYKVTGIPLISHNFFIENLLTYGIMFGFLWLFLFVYVAVVLINKIYSIKSYDEQKVFILFSLVFFQLIVFFMAHASGSIYIWFFIGLIIGFSKNKSCVDIRK